MAAELRQAVVVGAYGRREFLLRAVRSVELQQYPRDRIELIVTKNFKDAAIDRALEAAGATVRFDDAPEVGRWQRRAVAASTAPWVTILDDDDELEPGRLARVAEVAVARPDVAFYRNRVSVIDRGGAPVPPARWRRLESDPGFDTLGEVYLPAGAKDRAFEIGTRRTFATFNSSTMAFRREVLDGDLGAAFDRSWLPDTFLYLAATLGPGGLYLDPRRLTRYRRHDRSATTAPGWFAHAAEAEAEMAAVAERHGHAGFAAYFRQLAVHYARMARGAAVVGAIAARAPRREVARRTGAYLRHLGSHPAERRWTLDTWASGLYGLGYAVFPAAVRRLAAQRITAGSR